VKAEEKSARSLAGGIGRRKSRIRALLPAWLNTVLATGIRGDDPEARRRQRFVNVAAFVAAIATYAHGVEIAAIDMAGLWPLVVHNAVFGTIYLATPLFHRFGQIVGAIWLVGTIIGGTLNVVRLTGLEGGAHVYFTFAAVAFLFFGVRHWRWFALFVVLALAALVGSLALAPQIGPVGVGHEGFLQALSDQVLINVLIINVALFSHALIALNRAEEATKREFQRSEGLLRAILPGRVADRLKSRPHERIADRQEGVTILFADLVGFTSAAGECGPELVVGYLDGLFRAADKLAESNRIEKIKTNGDAYMAAAGLTGGDPRRAAADMARFALALRDMVQALPPLGATRLDVRIGLHTGAVVAGVIGDSRFSYDVWGDAVNKAARMESHGLPGMIQVSQETALEFEGGFVLERRGSIIVKGIGSVEAFFLQAEVAPAPGATGDADAARDDDDAAASASAPASAAPSAPAPPRRRPRSLLIQPRL
jgi:adenylate cyclase